MTVVLRTPVEPVCCQGSLRVRRREPSRQRARGIAEIVSRSGGDAQDCRGRGRGLPHGGRSLQPRDVQLRLMTRMVTSVGEAERADGWNPRDRHFKGIVLGCVQRNGCWSNIGGEQPERQRSKQRLSAAEDRSESSSECLLSLSCLNAEPRRKCPIVRSVGRR